MTEDRLILVAEDDESDVLLLRRAFRDAELRSPVHFAHDGQAAIEFLSERRQATGDRLPGLVILDLKMPRRTGMDVLAWLRQQPVLRTLPVMIFSSSARREDVETAYALGANGFLVKPASIAQRAEVARFFRAWLQLNQVPMASLEGFAAAHAAHLQRNFGAIDHG